MIGSILKELRAEKGITQVSLANTLNVKQSTISSWEIERTSPTLEQLGDLANIFDVTCDYLIGRTKDYNSEHEVTPVYKRRMLVQQANYSLSDALAVIQDYTAGSKNKEKLAEFLAHMNDSDFESLTNVVAAVIKSKEI